MPMDVFDRFLRPLRGGPLTRRYPDEPALLPPTFRGLPDVDPSRCDSSAACVSACPTGAITVVPGSWSVDAGRCVFCAACRDACPQGAIRLGSRFELASRSREGLRVTTSIGGPR
jgi:Formate hydrogenlyase subunit 6/NADH:ubiquinone oxidoreductase 23 kD subunit (chain I)